MYGPLAILVMLAASRLDAAQLELRPELGDEAWHAADQAVDGPPTDRDAGARVVEVALAHLGRPYRRGGLDPATGVDCATFVRLLFRPLGVELPSTAARQMTLGTVVLEDALAAGDLVFFRDTYKRGISHVGVYVGDGRFVHAAGRRSGIIVSLLSRPYYQRHFAGARRLLDRQPAPPATSADASGPGEPVVEAK
jgi:cell wall-associated NlpC family hydrolase